MQKYDIITIVFLVCIFCSEFNFLTIVDGATSSSNKPISNSAGKPAPVYSSRPGNAYSNCAYYSSCYTQSGSRYNTTLSEREANALTDIVQTLEFQTPPQITSVCKKDYNIAGITLNCQCSKDGSSCNITKIFLSGNKLHGSIPESLGNLSSLSRLSLSRNQLTGSIPETLKNLRNLKELYLYNNFLHGSIPSSLGALSNLTILYLGSNLLSGPIPDYLGNLSQLKSLNLEENLLSAGLPSDLGNLTKLERFSLSSNNLTGEIPKTLSQLTKVTQFDISGNSMSGAIPDFFKLWPFLAHLKLLGNNFEGKVPLEELFMLSELESLWISDVNNSALQFPGSANLTNIVSLTLRNCSLSGKIPIYFSQMPWLSDLDLSFNNLIGGIPRFMHNVSLYKMNLARNMLSGKIPGWLSNKDGNMVDISYNNFDEKYPKESTPGMNLFACCQPLTDERNMSATSLTALNIFSQSQEKHKYCPGKKPKYHSLFINCGGENTTTGGNFFDRDSETSHSNYSPDRRWAYSCSGEFLSPTASPADCIKNVTCGASVSDAPLYQKARLCPVSLTYYGFCLHKGEYNVMLHFAEIVYNEDDDFSSLGKRVFDVYVQGQLIWKDYNIKDRAGGPNNVTTENVTTYVDDDALLVIHLFWAGKGSLYVPPRLHGPLISAISVTPVLKIGPGKLSPLYIALITVASIVFALLILLAILWMTGCLGNRELYGKHVDIQGRSVTVRQLTDATRNFSSKMEIGRGGFGIVYKAEFEDQIVAVKKLSTHSKQGIEELKTELYALKALKHENLVQLLDGYSGNDLHLLIYEYMEHNSVARALFDPDSSLKLDWETRYSICLGIAKGLKYLHQESRLKIVHRDIKANNILLDKKLIAKISDFGLARLYDEGKQNMVTSVGGTHGYMAPEYAMRGIITEKTDVYSFGVVLLEIVSGRNNAEYKPKQETVFLLDTAYVLHKKGRLMSLVDKRMSKYDRVQVDTILNLAMMCTSQSPTLRPTMSEVVSVVEGHQTIEEVSSTRAPGPGDDDNRITAHMLLSSTDFSSTSTETSNVSSYYIIKGSDEQKNVSAGSKDEISNEGIITHQES